MDELATIDAAGGRAPRPPRSPSPFRLDDDRAYQAWRAAKLADYPDRLDAIRVPLADPGHPTPGERAAIHRAIRRSNMAIYSIAAGGGDCADRAPRTALKSLLRHFGLVSVERHRSAEDDGLVSIEVSDAASKRGFIPYTTRPISWHTDGYYNAPAERIRAMLLHCVRPAAAGGENALLDPEVAFIRLRDARRDFIAALMHPQAMSIPPSIEEDGSVRPLSVGPVFAVEADGTLLMRYTARSRSIVWRDDPVTREAAAFLESLLKDEREPLILKALLAAGEGLICNNVLHTRTAFDDSGSGRRLLLRARFATRIAEHAGSDGIGSAQ